MMRRNLLTSVLALSVAGVTLGQPPPPSTSAEPSAFHAVTGKLDPGGSLYAYVSTDQLLGRLSAKVGDIRDFVLGLPNLEGRERDEVRQVFTVLNNVIQHSGVEAIRGIGFSGIALEKGFYRTRAVVQRTPDSEGYLWQWFGKRAGPLELLNWLPADTAYAASVEIDFAAIWAAVQREARAAGVNPVLEGMRELSGDIQGELGVSSEALLASLDGTVGLALRLDRQESFEMPFPTKATLQMPQPALMLALKVRNDLLFRTIEKKLREEAPSDALASGKDGSVRWIGLREPAPMPFPVQPILAQAGDYLWFASTRSVWQEMRQVRSGDLEGLKGVGEFRRLSGGLPTEGNSFGFVSERFGRTLAEIQQAVLQRAMEGQGGRAGVSMTMLIPQLSFYTGLPASYAVGWFDVEGAQSVAQGTQEPVAQLASTVLVAPTAMFAGMMLPRVFQAKRSAQEAVCMNNMKQILLGLILYATDHDEQFPAELAKISGYLGGGAAQVLFCPLDPRKPEPRATTQPDLDPSECSYEFVTPGIKLIEAEQPSRTVALRCRFHGHQGFLDGHVEKRQTR